MLSVEFTCTLHTKQICWIKSRVSNIRFQTKFVYRFHKYVFFERNTNILHPDIIFSIFSNFYLFFSISQKARVEFGMHFNNKIIPKIDFDTTCFKIKKKL